MERCPILNTKSREKEKAPPGGSLFPFRKKIFYFERKKMNDENNKIKKLLSDLPIRNKSNFSKAPPHDGATPDGHQKSANLTVRQTADRSHDNDVMQNIFSCQK